MSDTPDFPSASLTSSGYGDGLGRRTLAFDRETGGILERLVLRPELRVFEQAIAERIDQAAGFEDERFARPHGVDRDQDSGAVVVVSEHLQGSRLSDLLDGLSGDAAETQAAPGLDAALGFLLEVLPALAALHASAGFVHGAVGAGRTVITPGGEVVLLDWVYGHILARLGWSPARLWRELGIAVPSEGGPGVVDAVGDIAQAALTAALLVTGRPLPLEAQAEGLAASLPEMVEIAQIRGSQPFAAGIERFLHRALLLPGSAPFTGAEEAADAVRRIAAEIGDSECRAALPPWRPSVPTAIAPASSRRCRPSSTTWPRSSPSKSFARSRNQSRTRSGSRRSTSRSGRRPGPRARRWSLKSRWTWTTPTPTPTPPRRRCRSPATQSRSSST